MKSSRNWKTRKRHNRDRIVTFGEIGAWIRHSVLFVSFAALAFVVLLEIPIKALVLSVNLPSLFWLASFLTGSFFILIVRWADTARSVHLHPAGRKMSQIVLFGIIAYGFANLLVLIYLLSF